jgi:hypothetical protein
MGWWKRNKSKKSPVDKFEDGEITIEQAQKLLDLKSLESSVLQTENFAKDSGNLVDLRKIWGRVILGILIVTIVGDMLLIGMVGSGVWTFETNTYFLNIVITEHLVQIFGLVLVVLKALFPTGNKD